MKVLFLSIPSHGHMNPILGLAAALSKQGEAVTFFSSNEFKKAVEATGAEFQCYNEDLNIFRKRPSENITNTVAKSGRMGPMQALFSPEKFIDNLLEQIQGRSFDYIIFSAAYPYASVIAQILNIPSISSYAVFASFKDLTQKNTAAGKPTDLHPGKGPMGLTPELQENFQQIRTKLIERYGVTIPENILDALFNKGDLNIIYTSKYFVPDPCQYDESYIFIGPPVYEKAYHVDFPFEKLKDKSVIYISLGTIFSNYVTELNELFFKAFGNTDHMVVMAAYDVDLSAYTIPENFIIRNYIPQLEILKYTKVAITHSGMNSIGDLLFHNIPFVAIPLGADQFFLANRAAALGATKVLDIQQLDVKTLQDAVAEVTEQPAYLENIHKISDSFRKAGGYEKAVAAIFRLTHR